MGGFCRTYAAQWLAEQPGMLVCSCFHICIAFAGAAYSPARVSYDRAIVAPHGLYGCGANFAVGVRCKILNRRAAGLRRKILQWCTVQNSELACGAKFCTGIRHKILNRRAAQNFAPAYGAKFCTSMRRKILQRRTVQNFEPAYRSTILCRSIWLYTTGRE